MLEKTTLIKVRNRNHGKTGYVVPDLNVDRIFEPNEVKEIQFEELRQLVQVAGGREIISEYLLVDNEEAVQELLGNVEPEYFYTKEHVNTLLSEGSKEQLEDALHFAPEGVKEMIKNIAIETELNDMSKRKLISQELDFDVNRAIEINEEAKEGIEEAPTATRKAQPITTQDKTPTNERKSMPVYNVVK